MTNLIFPIFFGVKTHSHSTCFMFFSLFCHGKLRKNCLPSRCVFQMCLPRDWPWNLRGLVSVLGPENDECGIYPLVNVYITMENHHFNGKIHYFYGHFFNSYVTNYQRVHEFTEKWRNGWWEMALDLLQRLEESTNLEVTKGNDSEWCSGLKVGDQILRWHEMSTGKGDDNGLVNPQLG